MSTGHWTVLMILKFLLEWLQSINMKDVISQYFG